MIPEREELISRGFSGIVSQYEDRIASGFSPEEARKMIIKLNRLKVHLLLFPGSRSTVVRCKRLGVVFKTVERREVTCGLCLLF